VTTGLIGQGFISERVLVCLDPLVKLPTSGSNSSELQADES